MVVLMIISIIYYLEEAQCYQHPFQCFPWFWENTEMSKPLRARRETFVTFSITFSLRAVGSGPGKVRMMLTMQTATKHRLSIRSMWGTLALTASVKCPSFAYSPPGLTSLVAIGANTNEPKPNPPIIIPEIRPGWFGNQSQPWCMATM